MDPTTHLSLLPSCKPLDLSFRDQENTRSFELRLLEVTFHETSPCVILTDSCIPQDLDSNQINIRSMDDVHMFEGVLKEQDVNLNLATCLKRHVVDSSHRKRERERIKHTLDR